MTNKYFIHNNKLCIIDYYSIQFYPDRFSNNYELHLHFYFSGSSKMYSKIQNHTYTFNTMEDVLASLGILNFNILQHYQTNHPELFI